MNTFIETAKKTADFIVKYGSKAGEVIAVIVAVAAVVGGKEGKS